MHLFLDNSIFYGVCSMQGHDIQPWLVWNWPFSSLTLTRAWRHTLLYVGFCCFNKTLIKTTLEKKELLCQSLKGVRPRTQGGHSKGPWMEATTWRVFQVHIQLYFLYSPGTLPTVGWALLHQSLIKKKFPHSPDSLMKASS